MINNCAILKSEIQLFHSCIRFAEERILLSKVTAYGGSWFSEGRLTQHSTKPRLITTRNDLGSKYTCIYKIRSFFFSEDQAGEFLLEFF